MTCFPTSIQKDVVSLQLILSGTLDPSDGYIFWLSPLMFELEATRFFAICRKCLGQCPANTRLSENHAPIFWPYFHLNLGEHTTFLTF